MQRRTVLKSLCSGTITSFLTGCIGAKDDSGGAETGERNTSVKGSTSTRVYQTETKYTSKQTTSRTTKTREDRKTTNDTTTVVPSCNELREPDFSFNENEITYDSLNGFELKATPKVVRIGEKIIFELENTTQENRETGNKQKYDLQYHSKDGWKSIFKLKHRGWSSQAFSHPPNEGFVWKQNFSKTGLSSEHKYDPSYYVCSEIRTGTYRFLYWGLTNTEKHSVLATKFTVKK
ncbi:hypothetical protein [Halorussus caseinilyticus]|uniref:hypothetical protein n=1 Tax=Halorussus caseinilyticus TaxID=3034025 RepID=UPI0023E7FD40|nr:hypothetical protein [Halorussus sp. DT72]